MEISASRSPHPEPRLFGIRFLCSPVWRFGMGTSTQRSGVSVRRRCSSLRGDDQSLWYCVRQRAGPLVKECRALRPRLSANDTPYQRNEKNKILRPPRDSSGCRTRVDRLELRLALFCFAGIVYTLTFDPYHLPDRFSDVRKRWRSFLRLLNLWKPNWSRDYIYLIEGRQ